MIFIRFYLILSRRSMIFNGFYWILSRFSVIFIGSYWIFSRFSAVASGLPKAFPRVLNFARFSQGSHWLSESAGLVRGSQTFEFFRLLFHFPEESVGLLRGPQETPGVLRGPRFLRFYRFSRVLPGLS